MSSTSKSDLVLGEDWMSERALADSEMRSQQGPRGRISINRSPLARKIIVFNLIGLVVLVAGVLYLNPFRDSLLLQRQRELVAEAELIAQMLQLQAGEVATTEVASLPDGTQKRITSALSAIHLPSGIEVFVNDLNGDRIAHTAATARPLPKSLGQLQPEPNTTVITDALAKIWSYASHLVASASQRPEETVEQLIARIVPLAASNGTYTEYSEAVEGGAMFAVSTPLTIRNQAAATLTVLSSAHELDATIRRERETLLQMFLLAMVVSIALSLILASTIANPLSELAAAAELGRSKSGKESRSGRVRIPDLTGRPDEIGRLSGALRGMVTALYDRIDANEQFAADVSHEIKNPLASLRSAIGTLRFAQRDAQREKLLDVIDHDVRRLDRLVTDISNASRLDSELVKEEEETFELLHMLKNITDHLTLEATKVGIDFVTDMPDGRIEVAGLEARLAQVFVNLITNALSFCEDGDAIRVWARRRENRVLVVVEDTGPGIPDQALTKVFNRFYSERPEHQFGDNSGLGLAISKQIVEAHGGVIWAENIRPTDADITSEPLGARFVVGLPL